ncbi:MAG: hypothetical protein LBE74_02995 [Treponema sp.]|nr:hypothetical protein [Treponema sp.]
MLIWKTVVLLSSGYTPAYQKVDGTTFLKEPRVLEFAHELTAASPAE